MEAVNSLGTVPSKRSSAHGLALIEMALILPLLLILSSAAIEYGWLFLNQHELTNASRQAARYASLPDTTSSQVTDQIFSLMSQYGLAKSKSDYTVVLTPSDVTTA
jgi:Flp pilus assembly protein TadG